MKDPGHVDRLSFDATFVDEIDFALSLRQEGNRVFKVTVCIMYTNIV